MKSIHVRAAILAMCIAFVLPSALGAGYVLHIFGNANMDGTIDAKDIDYLKEIISGKANKTDMADANYDGKIDQSDIAQVERIISGTESNLTILDGNGLAITINEPVERVVAEYLDNADMMQILKKTDAVVGVDLAVAKSPAEFPELSRKINVGAMYKDPDYEKLLSLKPDVLLTFSNATAEKQKNLPGVSVLFAGLYYPDLLNPDDSAFTDGVHKLGYIMNARPEAENYIKWHIDTINRIKSLTEKIPAGKKPSVLVAAYPDADKKTLYTFAKIDTLSNMVSLAGGETVAADLPDFLKSAYRFEVDPEWVIQQDPDYIILLVVATTYSGVIMDPPSGYEADDPSGMKSALEAFMSRPEYSNLTAVKNSNVYILSGNMRNDASKGLIGAAYLAQIFHPGKLGGLDPEELHQEYLQKYLGINYNLNDHGVFIYPPVQKDGRLEGVPENSTSIAKK